MCGKDVERAEAIKPSEPETDFMENAIQWIAFNVDWSPAKWILVLVGIWVLAAVIGVYSFADFQ